MKKFLAMILALSMVFALCACGTAAPAAPAATAAPAEPAAPAEEAAEPAAPAVDFPTKQFTIICPYAAGGASDVICRLYAEALQEKTGLSVIVENRTGAGGVVGFQAGLDAAHDGYTITYVPFEITTVNAMGYTDITPADFTFLGKVMQIPATIVVPATSEFETLDDLLAYAKEHPGELTIGNAGAGSSYHQGALKLEKAAGVTFNHIAFTEGAAPCAAALLGGSIMAAALGGSEVKSYVESGEFRLLAVLSQDRVSTFPDAPTAVEQGYDAVAGTWGAFVVPNDISADIVAILRDLSTTCIDSQDLKDALVERGFVHDYVPGAEWEATVADMFVENSALIKEFGLAG